MQDRLCVSLEQLAEGVQREKLAFLQRICLVKRGLGRAKWRRWLQLQTVQENACVCIEHVCLTDMCGCCL